MRKVLGFSHIVIESDNIKEDLKNFIMHGYNVRFSKRLIVQKEKQKILCKKPSIVKAIFLEKKNSLNIELIEHNIQRKSQFNKVLIGTYLNEDKSLLNYCMNDKLFMNSLNIIIKTNNFFKEINFYKKMFKMKNLKISKKQFEYFNNNINNLYEVKGLKLINNLFIRNQINFYFLKIKYNKKKFYLNESGISCISFFDFYKNSDQLLDKLFCGPLKLNIKESKISKYYFIKDPDQYLIEVLN